jgi:hypothetical protein
MKKVIYFLLGAASLVLFYKFIYDGTTETKSNLNGKYYKVSKEQNADLLALLDIKFNIIINSLKNSKYASEPSVKRLVSNWNRGVSIKEIGRMESDAAYVINKQYMSFCLPKETIKSVDGLNLMTYVGIHELSHIMSVEIGHGSEFISNFDFLLNYAKTLNYYDPLLKTQMPVYIQLDKLNTPDNYCGVQLVNSMK